MENTTKSSSLLAIMEKKTDKPGGCAGVFFQLFDWNRRSGKKKLFSNKFLPPARAKQGSKKFRADEKMPSSKLIADENRIVDFPKQREMRSPSLVARLMGLESIPVAAKKASFSEDCEKGLEKRSMRMDSRPPNLRKNDDSEKKMAIRFGTEALPLKSMLSRSRKDNHPPKLPSPIKSPKFSLGRSAARTSRLIDAAARILEPGLQATSRAKCGITYSHYESHDSIDSAIAGGYNFVNFDEFGQNTGSFPSVYRSLPSYSDSSFSRETARSETLPSLKPERDLLFERMPIDQQYRSPSASKPRKLRKHDCSSLPFKHGNQSLNQISPSRERVSVKSKPSNLRSGRGYSSETAPGGARDSLAFSRGKARTPIKLENGEFDMEKRIANGREDPLPQLRTSVRKRRTTGPSGTIDFQCDNAKQRNIACGKSSGRRSGLDPCSTNHYSCDESKLAEQEEAKGIDGSFRDLKNDRFSATMEGEIMDKRGISYQRKYSVGGDAIGVLLEQKLKELSSHEEDESMASFSSKRSTAIILQELITALTADPPSSRDRSVAETNTARDAVETETSTPKNVNQSSPGSVLEASFSSGSLDDGFGSRFTDRMDSASTINKIGTQMLSDISSMLQTINLCGVRLTGGKLSYAEEVLLHTQLLFGNLTRHFINESLDSLLTSPLFRDDERNTRRGFLFDCLIECLDSKYSPFCNFGSRVKLPACLNPRTLVRDVEDEVKKWKSFTKMSLDNTIELEMSRSSGKWTEFGSDGFETGIAIEQDIVQDLVGEIVVDFLVGPSNMS